MKLDITSCHGCRHSSGAIDIGDHGPVMVILPRHCPRCSPRSPWAGLHMGWHDKRNDRMSGRSAAPCDKAEGQSDPLQTVLAVHSISWPDYPLWSSSDLDSPRCYWSRGTILGTRHPDHNATAVFMLRALAAKHYVIRPANPGCFLTVRSITDPLKAKHGYPRR